MIYIYVNQQPHEAPSGVVTYAEVVAMSGVSGHPAVTYSKGVGGNTGAILTGQSVSVIAGMVFEVSNTGIGG